jgi:hypothetical protein
VERAREREMKEEERREKRSDVVFGEKVPCGDDADIGEKRREEKIERERWPHNREEIDQQKRRSTMAPHTIHTQAMVMNNV